MHFPMENIISPMHSEERCMSISAEKPAIDLMKYVDEINVSHGGEGTKMYSTAGSKFKKLCNAESAESSGCFGAASRNGHQLCGAGKYI